jgi:hypothetical protein
MNRVSIHWYDQKKQNLVQGIRGGLEFCFASPDNKQCSPFAYCKDYLQDALQAHLTKTKKSKFGFTYDPKVHAEVCISKCKLLVANSSDPKFRNKIPICLDFIHQIEDVLKIKKTVARECLKPARKYANGRVWLFQGSNRWIKSPPMISMYTLLIRVGFNHEIGKIYYQTIDEIISQKKTSYQTADRHRLQGARDGIKRILRIGDRKIFHRKIEDNYPKHIKISTMHGVMGIVGFSKKINQRKYMPYWHRKGSE